MSRRSEPRRPDQKKQPGTRARRIKLSLPPPAPNEQNVASSTKESSIQFRHKALGRLRQQCEPVTAATDAAPSHLAPSVSLAPDSDRSRNVEVAVANASQAMTAALQGLALQFN
jgi:multidrug efflux pump subunit AcrB